MAYEVRVNSTDKIAQDVENFNGTVSSIDKFSTSSFAGNRMAVLIEYTQ